MFHQAIAPAKRTAVHAIHAQCEFLHTFLSPGSPVIQQVRTGLKLGLGLALFLLGGITLSITRGQIEVLRGGEHASAWIELAVLAGLVLSVGLLFFTAHLWYRWLAGCLLFVTVKGLIALVTARAVLPVRQISATRTAAAVVVLYSAATLLSMLRFIDTRPTAIDRLALTFYFLCLLPTGSSFPSSWEIAGLFGLLSAWIAFQLQRKGQRIE